MTPTLIFLAGLMTGALFGAVLMALIQGAARLGEDEPEPQGYVNQDGESTPGNAWRNAAVKVPHVE